MYSILILLAQVMISKRYHPRYGIITALISQLCVITLLCVMEVIEYDEMANSAPLSIFILPILFYGLIFIGIYYLVYQKLKRK